MAREDLDEALLRQSVGSQQARRINEEERRIVAAHEAGHALCRKLLGLDPPEILSIVPRGPALGFVAHSPRGGRYLRSRDELHDEVVTLLGGRAAEEEVFGELYTGAQSTTSRGCTWSASRWSASSGWAWPIDYDGPPPIAIPTGDYAVSDETRRDVDIAAMTLAREAYRRARALLAANRACLDDLADAGARARDADARGTRRDLRRPRAARAGRAARDRRGTGRHGPNRE